MKLTKLSAIALAAIAMMSIANAGHSSSPCADSVETIDAGAAKLYLVSTWIYLESNGHDGLQRGGVAWYEIGDGSGVDDECWDRDASGTPIEDPDMIIF